MSQPVTDPRTYRTCRTPPPDAGTLALSKSSRCGMCGALALLSVPLGDGAFVGRLGVLGDGALGLASLLAVQRLPRAAGLARLGAGLEFDASEFLGVGGRHHVGVIAFGGEQMPEENRHLARGRDDRDLVAAAGADAFVEAFERSWAADRGQ